MEIKLTKEYTVIAYRKVDLIIEDLEDLKSYIINNKPLSKIGLKGLIEDYFYYEADIDVPINNDDSYHDDLDITINNLEELIQHFSYMINPEETCCSDQADNYCSNCGAKLR